MLPREPGTVERVDADQIAPNLGTPDASHRQTTNDHIRRETRTAFGPFAGVRDLTFADKPVPVGECDLQHVWARLSRGPIDLHAIAAGRFNAHLTEVCNGVRR